MMSNSTQPSLWSDGWSHTFKLCFRGFFSMFCGRIHAAYHHAYRALLFKYPEKKIVEGAGEILGRFRCH